MWMWTMTTYLNVFCCLFIGDNQFLHWLTYGFIFAMLFCIMIQMIYLNKARDTFNTAVVTPTYYVCFTTFVVVASSILYKVRFKTFLVVIC